MRRLLAPITLTAALAFAGCNDRSPNEPTPAAVRSAPTSISANRGGGDQGCRAEPALERYLRFVRARHGRRAEVRREFLALLGKLESDAGAAKLQDVAELIALGVAVRPKGDGDNDRDDRRADEAGEALHALIDAIIRCAGVTGFSIDPDVFGPNGAIGVVVPGKQTIITTSTQFAGVAFQDGSVNVPALVTITPLPKPRTPGSGPLRGSPYPQYGPFYDIVAYALGSSRSGETSNAAAATTITLTEIKRFDKPVGVDITTYGGDSRFAPPNPTMLSLAHVSTATGAFQLVPSTGGVGCPERFTSPRGFPLAAAPTVNLFDRALAFVDGLVMPRELNAFVVTRPSSATVSGCAESFSPWGVVDLFDAKKVTLSYVCGSTFKVVNGNAADVYFDWKTSEPSARETILASHTAPTQFTTTKNGRPIAATVSLLYGTQAIATLRNGGTTCNRGT